MYNDNIPYPESYDIKYDTLNFRLDNGEEIKFKDLFTKDASPKNILAQSIYDNLALEYGISNDDGSSDLDLIDYGKIENDVFENVYNFINQDEENQNFFFNETDIYDYINIYNIISPSESLYESGNREKVNYAFGINYFYNFEYYDFVDDNKFLSIYNMYKPDSGNVYMENSENIETFSKAFSDYKNKIIDAVKKDIKNASSKKGYLYNISFFNLPDTENGFPSFSGQRLEIDLTNFKEKQESSYISI